MSAALLIVGVLAVATHSSYGSTPCTRTPLQTITVTNETVRSAIEKKMPKQTEYQPGGSTKYYDAPFVKGAPEYIMEVEGDIFFTPLQSQCKSISTEDQNDEAPVTEEQANPDGNLPDSSH
ncbi:unnamed protein product [Nippostrongylus brasiliensis]|uniref:Uncharacterized protein n=1 Tax=Nippostrongylus brasiliensis TaxID=27835 RepID=A0A0N4Y750_NIPBR|nr:unnamed protein product [Nippostrongylus brasiliensis]